MNKLFFLFSIIITVSMSCASSNEGSTEIDTPTSGEINMSVDETLQPIAEAQVDVFQHTYPNAKVNIRYRSENDCVKDLYNDSSKIVFLGRKLNDDEMKLFKAQTFNPPHVKICTDAIALLINKTNPDTNITYDRFVKILRGEDKKYNVVFDNGQSGAGTFLLKLAGGKLGGNAYSIGSNLKAVNYVMENPNAIGVIGWSWISDSDDPKTREYLSKVNLVSLSSKSNKDEGFYKPYQLNLAQDKYPLLREVYAIQRERRNGLSAGFTAFVNSEIGQTIMLKAGLLPANQQERWIQINTKPMGKVQK
jgi:phosphate transport system substrate-binding protein